MEGSVWSAMAGNPVRFLLTAIVATSFAANHRDLRALAEYPHKASTAVYVSSGQTRVFFDGEWRCCGDTVPVAPPRTYASSSDFEYFAGMTVTLIPAERAAAIAWPAAAGG